MPDGPSAEEERREPKAEYRDLVSSEARGFGLGVGEGCWLEGVNAYFVRREVKVELSDLGIQVCKCCQRVALTVGYGTQAQGLEERVRREPSKSRGVVRENSNPGG